MQKEKTQLKDFTKGNLFSQIIGFAFPILLSYFFMIMLNTVDMVVVGKKYGEAGTSAVSIGASVAMFINAFLTGFMSAAQVVISRILGSGKREKLSGFVSTLCGFTFALAILFAFIMIPLIQPMLSLLNTPTEAYDGAYTYSLVCLIGIVPIFAYHSMSAIYRGMGDSKHPFIFIAIACTLNIILDVLFVTVLDMGVMGAAVATVIAQLVSVICSAYLLIKRHSEFGLNFGFSDFLHWKGEELFPFIKLALPMAFNAAAIQVAIMVVNAMTNDFGVSVSAFAGIKANIDSTVTLVFEAFTMAASMIIAQNIAAGKLKRVRKSMLFVGAISLSIAAVISLAIVIFPMDIFGIFTDEKNVLMIVSSYIPIAVLTFVAMGLRPITKSLVDGSGSKIINIVNALLDAVAARIGFAVIFGIILDMGYIGFWLGAALAMFVPIIVELIFFISGVWKKNVVKD